MECGSSLVVVLLLVAGQGATQPSSPRLSGCSGRSSGLKLASPLQSAVNEGWRIRAASWKLRGSSNYLGKPGKKTHPLGPVEKETKPKILGKSVHFWLCLMCHAGWLIKIQNPCYLWDQKS